MNACLGVSLSCVIDFYQRILLVGLLDFLEGDWDFLGGLVCIQSNRLGSFLRIPSSWIPCLEEEEEPGHHSFVWKKKSSSKLQTLINFLQEDEAKKMDAELQELQRLFEQAQEAKPSVRLSDRNVVELVSKLQELHLLDADLLHTVSGKEYITQVLSSLPASTVITIVPLAPTLLLLLDDCLRSRISLWHYYTSNLFTACLHLFDFLYDKTHDFLISFIRGHLLHLLLGSSMHQNFSKSCKQFFFTACIQVFPSMTRDMVSLIFLHQRSSCPWNTKKKSLLPAPVQLPEFFSEIHASKLLYSSQSFDDKRHDFDHFIQQRSSRLWSKHEEKVSSMCLLVLLPTA